MGLTPPLINLIVHTCFEYDAVLTNNLADRIANDWLQKGITTPTEAIAYLKERKNKRNQKQYYRTPKKTVHKLTDWSKYEKQNQTKKGGYLQKKEIKFFANLVKMNRKCCTGGRYF